MQRYLGFKKLKWGGLLSLCAGTAAYRFARTLFRYPVMCASDTPSTSSLSGLIIDSFKIPYSTVVVWPIQGSEGNLMQQCDAAEMYVKVYKQSTDETELSYPYTMFYELPSSKKETKLCRKRAAVGAIIINAVQRDEGEKVREKEGLRKMQIPPINVLAVHCYDGLFHKLSSRLKVWYLKRWYQKHLKSTLDECGEPTPYIGEIKLTGKTIVFMPYPQHLKHFRPAGIDPMLPMSAKKTESAAEEARKEDMKELEARKSHQIIAGKQIRPQK